MIISIGAEKAINKVQYSFMIKTSIKVGVEGVMLYMIKAICEKPTGNIIHNRKKSESFPTKIRNKTRTSIFTTPIHHSIGSPSHSDQTRRRNKRHPDWKGGSKTVIVCR